MRMTTTKHFLELSRVIARFSKQEGENATPIPGVTLFKASSVDTQLPSVYNPCLCIIAQGSKEVRIERHVMRYSPSQYLMVGVDLPIMNKILKATKVAPYLLMKIAIDLQQVTELIMQMTARIRPNLKSDQAIYVGNIDEQMADSILRLARMLDRPEDIPVLANHTLREIFYFILRGEHGSRFAQTALYGSSVQRVAQAIRKIKTEYRKPISVNELADLVGMSISSFHAHFKTVTSMSPHQFQKKLRLIEAKNLMATATVDATRAAYAVGYESPSQFSREYARMYGNPPGKDIELIRAGTIGR